MTFHTIRRKRLAKGSKPKAKATGRTSPRIAASYDAGDLRAARWLAKRKGLPLASILRHALEAYVKPFRVDLDAGREPIF